MLAYFRQAPSIPPFLMEGHMSNLIVAKFCLMVQKLLVSKFFRHLLVPLTRRGNLARKCVVLSDSYRGLRFGSSKTSALP